MSIGSTSGRAFESAAAPYVFGAILILCIALWLLFERDIRKRRKDEARDREEPGDDV